MLDPAFTKHGNNIQKSDVNCKHIALIFHTAHKI